MDWTQPLAVFNGKSSWDMAKLGYDKHISQHIFKFRVRIEGPNDCRLFGLYFTSVGPDVQKDDFLENIDPQPASPTPAEESETVFVSSSQDSPVSSGSDVSLPESSEGSSSSSVQLDRTAAAMGIAGVSAVFLLLLLYIVFIKRKRSK
jgi:hypothetical protein